jgi:queuine tRNA-ribosyltransferase
MRLMRRIRDSIKRDEFPAFIRRFFKDLYPAGNVPRWAVNALQRVNVHIDYDPNATPSAADEQPINRSGE